MKLCEETIHETKLSVLFDARPEQTHEKYNRESHWRCPPFRAKFEDAPHPVSKSVTACCALCQGVTGSNEANARKPQPLSPSLADRRDQDSERGDEPPASGGAQVPTAWPELLTEAHLTAIFHTRHIPILWTGELRL
eukprot:3203567-Amphidinium_carterae.1